MSDLQMMSGGKALAKYPLNPENWELLNGTGEHASDYVLSCKRAIAYLGYYGTRTANELMRRGIGHNHTTKYAGPVQSETAVDEWPKGLARGRRDDVPAKLGVAEPEHPS